MIVIGSQALFLGLQKAGMSLPYKRANRPDLDVICHSHEGGEFIRKAELEVIRTIPGYCLAKAPDGVMVELTTAPLGSSSHLYLFWAQTMAKLDTEKFYGVEMEVAPLEMLYSLKRAHRHSPRKFHQHVKDYNFLRQMLNGKDAFPKITEVRYAETMARDGKKTPSLNKTVNEFFDDTVSNKTFVHDEIHKVMAIHEKPMFESIRISPETVKCSKEKFEALRHIEKRQCVQEEAYVIALERAIIPMLFEDGPIARPEEAYRWAVMRICTNLTSGWFREWALENYDFLMRWYDPSYPETFLKAVEEGRIKRIER